MYSFSTKTRWCQVCVFIGISNTTCMSCFKGFLTLFFFLLLLRKEIETRIYVIFLKLLAPAGTVLQKLTTMYLSLLGVLNIFTIIINISLLFLDIMIIFMPVPCKKKTKKYRNNMCKWQKIHTHVGYKDPYSVYSSCILFLISTGISLCVREWKKWIWIKILSHIHIVVLRALSICQNWPVGPVS